MNFLTTNPFELLGTWISPILLQSFVVLMVALIIIGTLVDIIHKKNVKYFFENAKKGNRSRFRFSVYRVWLKNQVLQFLQI